MLTAFLKWDDINLFNAQALTIVSWNIHGVKEKLRNPAVLHFLRTHDIICLNELHSPQPAHIPGYQCYRGQGDHMHRGGCAMLIKNCIAKQVARVETPNAECIFLKLKSLPRVMFAACYLPPSDSPYHTCAPISEIQDHEPDTRFVIIGDLNARFGNNRAAFLEDREIINASYSQSPDPIASPNHNAKYTTNILGPIRQCC